MRPYRILHPKIAFVLITKYGDKVNAMALAWHTPVEEEKIAIAVDRENYSYDLLSKSKEFTLNVTEDVELIWKVGTTSGSRVDKIKRFGIELEDGIKIKTPHLKTAIAYLECVVREEVKLEEHSLIIADVVHAWADEGRFSDIWRDEKSIPPMHVGKNVFLVKGKYFKIKI